MGVGIAECDGVSNGKAFRISISVGRGLAVGEGGLGEGVGDVPVFAVGVGVETDRGVGLGDEVASGTNHSRISTAVCLIPVDFDNSAYKPRLPTANKTMIIGNRSHPGSVIEPQTARIRAPIIIHG